MREGVRREVVVSAGVAGGSIAHSTTEPKPRSNEHRCFRFAGAQCTAADGLHQRGSKRKACAQHAPMLAEGPPCAKRLCLCSASEGRGSGKIAA